MGGARFTKLLVGSIGVVVAGSLLAGARLWLVANDNGAAYSPFRQLGARSLPATRGSRPWLFQSLADAGYPVIDIEYRLAPPPRWHDAPADVLCAQPAVLGIDPSRVVLMGVSAGGSLALVAGDAAGANRITSSCPGYR